MEAGLSGAAAAVIRRTRQISSRRMAGRSPARFLAPLALVAAAVALVLVVSSSSPDDERVVAPSSAIGTGADGGSGATATSENGSKRGRRVRRFYKVKPGDTPSGIAEKTGVPLEDILSLNPTLDPQTLAPGTKIRLRR
jgi:LysM repeat protein